MGETTKLISLVTDDPPYGSEGSCIYTTYYEVKYFSEHKKPVIPVKMYESGEWPPTAKLLAASEKKSAAMLLRAFSPSVSYIDKGWTFDVDYLANKITGNH